MNIEKNVKHDVELFHLLFLEQLSQKLDKRLYALKGGCNLRFFLGSIRYSEDIDLDVQTVAPHTLANMVNRILSSPNFGQILKTSALSISDISTPKQTQITQRWKVQLKPSFQSLPINTKIEFSRRTASLMGITIGSIVREIISLHKLRPIFISHYLADSALIQKIKALILRNETQARDIFDIYHLIQTNQISIENVFTQEELQTALANLQCIQFAEFKSQVISYLAQNYQFQYNTPEIWELIIQEVSNYLRRYMR